MVNEVDEDTKITIAKTYREMQKNELIREKAEELGISEGTFHKYKNYEIPMERSEDDKTNKKVLENKSNDGELSDTDFEDTYKPDNDDKTEDSKKTDKTNDTDETDDDDDADISLEFV